MNDTELAIYGAMKAMGDMADNFKSLHSNLELLAKSIREREVRLVECARLYPNIPPEELIARVGRQPIQFVRGSN